MTFACKDSGKQPSASPAATLTVEKSWQLWDDGDLDAALLMSWMEQWKSKLKRLS